MHFSGNQPPGAENVTLKRPQPRSLPLEIVFLSQSVLENIVFTPSILAGYWRQQTVQFRRGARQRKRNGDWWKMFVWESVKKRKAKSHRCNDCALWSAQNENASNIFLCRSVCWGVRFVQCCVMSMSCSTVKSLSSSVRWDDQGLSSDPTSHPTTSWMTSIAAVKLGLF